MSARVHADPSVDVFMQPKIFDRADCPPWKRADCSCSFMCVNRAMFWLNLFYCRKHWFTATFLTESFLISFNNNNNKKECNSSRSGRNVLSLMSAEPWFFFSWCLCLSDTDSVVAATSVTSVWLKMIKQKKCSHKNFFCYLLFVLLRTVHCISQIARLARTFVLVWMKPLSQSVDVCTRNAENMFEPLEGTCIPFLV